MCAEDLAGCLQTLTVERGPFSCVWGTRVLGFSSVLCPWWNPGCGSESRSWEQGLAAPPTAARLGGVSWTRAQGPPGGLLSSITQPGRRSEASGRARPSEQPFPKFQFLLINIISAPVRVDKLSLSDEPVFLPIPNDVILTGSDQRRSLLGGGTEKRGLSDGTEPVARTLLFDSCP